MSTGPGFSAEWRPGRLGWSVFRSRSCPGPEKLDLFVLCVFSPTICCMSLLNVYCDESCKDAHKYLALGGLCVENKDEPAILVELARVREAFGQRGEVKWTKNRRQKLDFYKAFVDVYFDAAADDVMHFQGMYVDTTTFKHGVYNDGDRDLGFSKLIYQLLLHKFGRKYGAEHPMHVYLDSRVTRHKPEEMRPMLNADLRKRWSVATDPFRRITFQDSEKSDLVQLVDLLVGCVGATKNGHHQLENCAPHKSELREHIIKRALDNEPTRRLNWSRTKRFYVWKFQFHGR